MRWQITFYSHDTEEYIQGLDLDTRTKVLRKMLLLEELGPNLPDSKPLGDGLYELKIAGKNAQRFYYGFVQSGIVVTGHGSKNTKKGQQSDIKLARKRLKDLRNPGRQ